MTPEELELFSTTKEVLIETRDDDRSFRTIIWVVAIDGDLYVRSWLGDEGAWYQRVLVDPRVALIVEEIRVEFDVVAATDDATNDLVSAAFRDKYPKSRSTDGMVREEVLGTTLRLEPV